MLARIMRTTAPKAPFSGLAAAASPVVNARPPNVLKTSRSFVQLPLFAPAAAKLPASRHSTDSRTM